MLKLAVLEDSETMRILVVECLRDVPDIVISREVDEGKQALAYLIADTVDFVIADIRLRGGDSLATVRELKLRFPRTKVFGFSGSTNGAILREFQHAGVDAIFGKARRSRRAVHHR